MCPKQDNNLVFVRKGGGSREEENLEVTPADGTRRRNIRIYSIERSGHTAIVYWLCRLFKNPVSLQNNEQFNPDYTLRHQNKPCVWDRSEEPNLRRIGYDCHHCCTNTDLQDFEDKISRLDDDSIIHIRSFERHTLSFFKECMDHEQENSTETTNIIILRDPFNWAASIMKGTDKLFPWDQRNREKYIELGNEIIGNTNILPNKHFINYNLWTDSDEYKRSVCWDIGGNSFTTEGCKGIPDNGKGSSFHGTDIKALDGVHVRWKEFHNKDKEFIEWAENPVIKDFGKNIFGMTLPVL